MIRCQSFSINPESNNSANPKKRKTHRWKDKEWMYYEWIESIWLKKIAFFILYLKSFTLILAMSFSRDFNRVSHIFTNTTIHLSAIDFVSFQFRNIQHFSYAYHWFRFNFTPALSISLFFIFFYRSVSFLLRSSMKCDRTFYSGKTEAKHLCKHRSFNIWDI